MKRTKGYITIKQCRDCIFGRKDYGVMWCPMHYDYKKDNARAIRQTGTGVTL